MRQRDTALAIMAEAGLPAGELHTDARLDEYDHVGVFAGHGEEDRFAAATERTAESHRALQSALDEAIRRWIRADGSYAEPHATFAGRVGEVVRELAALPGTTVAVTSGGVIAVACAQLIGLSMEQWPALARVTVNGGVTKFITGPAGTHLLTFNDHAHLEGDRSLITYR
jgi:broad specificity phosphatase PhoE